MKRYTPEHPWFAHAKAMRGGFRIVSWQGAVTGFLFFLLLIGDFLLFFGNGWMYVFGILITAVFVTVLVKKTASPDSTLVN